MDVTTLGISWRPRSSYRQRAIGMAAKTLRDKTICLLCGPSGAGKSTLIKKLQVDYPGRFGFSVSHTTRPVREGEKDGVHYHFVSTESFESGVEKGEFLEHACVHGKRYGTTFAAIREVSDQGKVCILDVDVQGAQSIKNSELSGDTGFFFIKPPTMEVLEDRLRTRGTEKEEVILKRLNTAEREMTFLCETEDTDFWDSVLVNDCLDSCYKALVGKMLEVGLVERMPENM